MINTSPQNATDFVAASKQRLVNNHTLPQQMPQMNGNPPGGPGGGPGGGGPPAIPPSNGHVTANGLHHAHVSPMSPSQQPQHLLAIADKDGHMTNGGPPAGVEVPPSSLEKDYYGCYCLKFIVKNGTHITEDKVLEDFGQFGEVVDVRGPGLFSGLRGNHVYVRFIEKGDAEEALRNLNVKYHQLTPASISDVLPDNYGLYTISFYNKTGIPSAEVRREFSNFGEVKNLTGSLDVKGGRVFVSYKEKSSAVQALQAFFFRKDKYPNMKFALPRCEKDYFGCYCLKFYNKSGDITEEKVLRDFGQFGDVVDVRGPGLFDVTGDDVYVRYKEKSSAEQALIELVGKYDSLCLAPPSDIQADKFGYFTITFVNDKCLSKSDVWYIFSKFGTVACVNGTFDCKKGRVFVSYKEKQGALNALETMLITKEYHLQVSKNSTVRKNDYNVVANNKDSMDASEFNGDLLVTSGGNGSSSNATPVRNDKHSHNVSNNVPNGHMNGHGPHEDMLHQHLNHVTAVTTSNMPVTSIVSPPINNYSRNHQHRDHSRSREPSLVPVGAAGGVSVPPPNSQLSSLASPLNLASAAAQAAAVAAAASMGGVVPPNQQPGGLPTLGGLEKVPPPPVVPQQTSVQQPQQGQNAPGVGGGASTPGGGGQASNSQMSKTNGLVKFNRNVEKDIFGYFCLSFLNEDGDINEKKVRHDFGKFGEVVSVRGALGKQKGHVFVRFRRKEAAENCLNCLNSFPLSEMSELFGKYLYLSPATPRDIDCDMYGLYSISFLNLNMKTFREIRTEFSKFGEIVRLTTGGSGNTDELVSISYSDKNAAVKALQTHFTNKEFPYLDIAKGSSLLLVDSGDSSDNEENESEYSQQQQQHHLRGGMEFPNGSGDQLVNSLRQQPLPIGTQMTQQQVVTQNTSVPPPGPTRKDPFHDPSPIHIGPPGSDVVDELLKPFQSYFNTYRTGQYHSPMIGDLLVNHSNPADAAGGVPFNPNNAPPTIQAQQPPPPQQQQQQQQKSPEKKYRIKSMPKIPNGAPPSPAHVPPPPMPQQQHQSQQQVQQPHPASPSMARTPPTGVCPPAELTPNFLQMNGQEVIEKQQKVTTAPAPTSNPKVTVPISTNHSQAEPSIENSSSNLTKNIECSPEPNVAEETPEGGVAPQPTPEGSSSREIGPLEADVFGLFSLTFINKAKDLSERKVRLDFSKFGDVARIRGQFNNSGEVIIVSYSDKESAEKAVQSPSLASKYGPSLNTCPYMDVVPDKDGHFSIEFVNSGMNGIREITNEFSKHGEVMKVMAGGAKNAVKRVTVSFADRKAAFAAVKAHESSKDFVSIDFSRECLSVSGLESWPLWKEIIRKN